jgi:hypothetical protein
LWEDADNDEKMKNYKTMLTTRYLVDKNNDGVQDYNDYTGLLNETYYTYVMRPLYKCDKNDDMKDRHNAAHDGFGLNENSTDYDRCLWHKIFKSESIVDANGDICNACARKNGGYEATESDLGGVRAAEWASDWPAKCPDCEALAQHTLSGKVYVEYVRDPKPEFATLITISEDEYKEKIAGTKTDIAGKLAAVKGNEKVDLTTNYNRYGYGDNYESKSYITTEGNDPVTDAGYVVPDASAFSDGETKRYYFSVYEFYGEYALGETYTAPKNSSSITSASEGTKDAIEFNPDESKLKEFESLQEISEDYNRELWENWAKSVESGETVPANYRAVTILSALYKRKYYYNNMLATDSLQAGLYNEDVYDRPIANDYGTEDDPETYNKNFNEDHSSDDESDTALYGKNFDGFEEDKAGTNGTGSTVSDTTDDKNFYKSKWGYLYFYCPVCNDDEDKDGGYCKVKISAYNAATKDDEDGYVISSACSECGTKFYVNGYPTFTPVGDDGGDGGEG